MSLRKAASALAAFVGRSHEAVRLWTHRPAPISGAFQPGQAKVAVVDETGFGIAGEQAWVWLAMEPRSRRLLGIHLSWTRSIPAAESLLGRMKRQYGVRIVADAAPWYPYACMRLGLRLHVERGGAHSLLERLNREVKRRLKDFDISFPRSRSLQGARLWLRAWQTYYNWVRTHLTLGGPPCGSGSEPEPHRPFMLLQEAKP